MKEKPEKFTKVQPIAGIAFNFPFSPIKFSSFFETYVDELFIKFREPYFMYSTYFYTVHAKRQRDWREVAGMHIQAALPTSLDAAFCTNYIQQEVVSQFSIGKPNLSSSNTPPDVHVQQGGPAVGFRSLDAALDYLEQHPDKTVWVMSFDAPSFPECKKMDESSTLLILAHPDYKTEREPLAWIHRVASHPASAYTSAPGKGSAQQQAWQVSLSEAIDRANLQPQQIGYVIHDAGGMGKSAQGGKRIGMLGQALTTTLPDLDFTQQTFDTPALLGDLGAGTALTNLALAIAYAHHKNTPVLVAGTTEAEMATAVVVRPPAKPRIFDPEKNWFRAR